MKKFYFTYFLCFFLSVIYAQENKFRLIAGGDLGFSKIELNDQKLNASTNGAYLHVGYNLKSINVESGLEYIMSQGNFNSSGNSFFVENKYVSIPIGISAELELDKNSENASSRYAILIGGGLYTNYLLKSEAGNLYNESSVGWNFGSYGKFGIHIQVNEILSLGIGFKGQYDFSGLEKDDVISVRQSRNVVYLDFGVRL